MYTDVCACIPVKDALSAERHFWCLQGAFSADADVATLVQHLLLYVAAMQPLNALVFVGDGIGQGSQDFTYLSGAMVAAGAAALAFLLTGDASIDSVWQGLVVLQVCGWGWVGVLAWVLACVSSMPASVVWFVCVYDDVLKNDGLQMGRAGGLAWRYYGGYAAGGPLSVDGSADR